MSNAGRPLRIAMIGQRGVPATFGGIERHVEELGARLASAGHEVTVFCRTGYVADRVPTYRGMQLRHLPSVPHKHLDAISHSLLSSLVATVGRFDLVHYHAVGPGLTAPLTRWASRASVVLTVHGLDGDRAKWGSAAQKVLAGATWMSARVPDATIVVSAALAEHYRTRYARETVVIANGVDPGAPLPPGAVLDRLGLSPGRYLLFVGRFVPEKAPDRLVRSFRALADPELRLVLAGGSSFTDGYARELADLAASDPRVVLPGYVYGDDLRELYSNAGLFVLPSDLEGLPLTLLEAASYGVPVVASDIPPHREVLGSGGEGRRLFGAGDDGALTAELEKSLVDLPSERTAAAGLRADVLARYSWDAATAATIGLYRRLTGI